jgi:hypothetical protein
MNSSTSVNEQSASTDCYLPEWLLKLAIVSVILGGIPAMFLLSHEPDCGCPWVTSQHQGRMGHVRIHSQQIHDHLCFRILSR